MICIELDLFQLRFVVLMAGLYLGILLLLIPLADGNKHDAISTKPKVKHPLFEGILFENSCLPIDQRKEVFKDIRVMLTLIHHMSHQRKESDGVIIKKIEVIIQMKMFFKLGPDENAFCL